MKQLYKGAFQMNKKSTTTFVNWSDYKTTLDLTQDEWDEINLKVEIVGEIIKARESLCITQQRLGELSGVKHPVIARLEKNNVDPRLTTILKIQEGDRTRFARSCYHQPKLQSNFLAY